MYLELILKDLLDVLLLGYILYRVILLFAETRALRLAYGIAFLIVVFLVAGKLKLTALSGVSGGFNWTTLWIVILAILFAPEIREALVRLGAGARARFREQREAERKVIEEVVKGCHAMAKKKIGALIVMQREDGLEDYIRSGVALDSEVSAPLLESIFHPSSPLHDGAVVIKGNRLIAAKCILPLSESMELKLEGVGTRHRAALGLAELRDAAVLIVSEEKGSISLAESGKMLKYLEDRRLSHELMALFVAGMKKAERRARFDLKKALFANLHWKVAALAISLLIWAFMSQEIQVRADISFDPRDYPTQIRAIEDGSMVALDPGEMKDKALTLRGDNWRLYQVLIGLLRDERYLDGHIRIPDPPPLKDAHEARRMLETRHLGGTIVKETVILHELESIDPEKGGPRENCSVEHPLRPDREKPEQFYLHVAEVATIPKAKVGVKVFGTGRLPRGYEALPPVIEFKRPDDPLISLQDDREAAGEFISKCDTEPRILLNEIGEGSEIPETYEIVDVKLVLPRSMQGIPLNHGGDVVRRIVVPIRAGKPPAEVAEAERVRDEAKEDADAQEVKAKEEMEEIRRQQALVNTDPDEFKKALDLDRLDQADSRLSDCEKEIERAGEKLTRIRKQLEGAEGEDADMLRSVLTHASQHVERYVDITEKWQKELKVWVRELEKILQPVLEEQQQVVEEQEKLREAEEALSDAELAAGAWSQTPAYRDLTDALAKRLEALKALPPDPTERLKGMAALFPSADHAAACRGLEKGLRDKASAAREIQRQIERVSQRKAETQQPRFPALAEQRLLLARKRGERLVMEFEVIEKGLVVAQHVNEQACGSVTDEHSLMQQKLDGLRSDLPAAESSPGEGAAERLREVLMTDLEPALEKATEAKKQAESDLEAVRSDLAELSTPPEEAEGEAGGDPVKDEWDALQDLEDLVKKRRTTLATEVRLLTQARNLALEYLKRFEAAAPPGTPPEETGEPGGSEPPPEPPPAPEEAGETP